jgi:hypothetical protein
VRPSQIRPSCRAHTEHFKSASSSPCHTRKRRIQLDHPLGLCSHWYGAMCHMTCIRTLLHALLPQFRILLIITETFGESCGLLMWRMQWMCSRTREDVFLPVGQKTQWGIHDEIVVAHALGGHRQSILFICFHIHSTGEAYKGARLLWSSLSPRRQLSIMSAIVQLNRFQGIIQWKSGKIAPGYSFCTDRSRNSAKPNNPWGTRGTLKCIWCRERKQRVLTHNLASDINDPV